jgi:hypothetical protein
VILGEKDKIYYFDGRSQLVNVTDFSVRGIRQVLREKNREIARMIVLVKPSKESRYQNLIDILDEIDITKVPHFYIVKETPEDVQRVALFRK